MIATAALIAAISFAVLTVAGVFALLRLSRALGDARALVTEFRGRGDELFARAGAAVDRANQQLDRTDAVTASMDELGADAPAARAALGATAKHDAGMAELAGQVQTVAGIGRALGASPAGKLAAFAYGVRHAIGIRRAPRTIPGQLENPPSRDHGAFRADSAKKAPRSRTGAEHRSAAR
jgi:hypothetical protein